ncbi:deoxyribodipyrimidine photo-lyase [Thermocrinis minervae]|uniref:Deoxyribodipyrimidine photo-lyase n=1 Tax=Thermocrinis minervae TaxID=381751 RepID=A0A1M6SU26_9AQUI|nr:deoxyribodipyrimidine photo-lyase [Thermocrinis minervae]SHK48130.1 Deoxyribodipyrimidine photo-lyase type II [Thermocrinis minervae]
MNTPRVQKERVFKIKDGAVGSGPVVYWMSRDQRAVDNWALIYAQDLALELKRPLVVVFCLVERFLEATIRQYAFMLKGLKEVKNTLKEKNVGFYLLVGNPEEEIPKFVEMNHVAILVTDFDPLRIKLAWKERVKERVKVPFYEVDAHNIIPCRYISDRCEPSAFTFRKKVKKYLDKFLVDFPNLEHHPFSGIVKAQEIEPDSALTFVKVDRRVGEVDWIKPGTSEGLRVLKEFIENKLEIYHLKRNDPNANVQSNLSPYLHFGQVSSQRVALEVLRSDKSQEAKESFLEELIVRKELSDNFCLYNKNYDSFEGFPQWAKESLNKHRKDIRKYVYSLEEFEEAKTHDKLWNACQMQMVRFGKMHGYLRMYWAKKILEWSESPEEALRIAIYLNDKYELDGRDPNGYTGIAWSIGGVHDRPFKEREIIGKLRYMSYEGCRKKFNVEEYIRKFLSDDIKLYGDKTG